MLEDSKYKKNQTESKIIWKKLRINLFTPILRYFPDYFVKYSVLNEVI